MLPSLASHETRKSSDLVLSVLEDSLICGNVLLNLRNRDREADSRHKCSRQQGYYTPMIKPGPDSETHRLLHLDLVDLDPPQLVPEVSVVGELVRVCNLLALRGEGEKEGGRRREGGREGGREKQSETEWKHYNRWCSDPVHALTSSVHDVTIGCLESTLAFPSVSDCSVRFNSSTSERGYERTKEREEISKKQ